MRLGIGNKFGSGNSILRKGLPISGFAYPNETLIAPTGASYQWYVNDVARGTTQTLVLTVDDIGLVVRCVVGGEHSPPVTVWHPRDISAVKHFFWAAQGAYSSLGNNFTDETAPITVSLPETKTLTRNGSLNGKAVYGEPTLDPQQDWCYWDSTNSRWELNVITLPFDEPVASTYYSTDNTTYPWQATTWTGSQTVTRVATTVDTLATDGQAIVAWKDIIGGVNAISTSPNSGLFESTDLDTASVKFDSTDFFNLASSQRSVFNSQNCCYIFAGAQDSAPTAGDATHGVVSVNRTSTIPKLGLSTRSSSSSLFAASASSNNSTAVSATSASNANYNVLAAEVVFSEGSLRLRANGSQLDSVGISTTLPNNTVTGSFIGAATSSSTTNFNGYMTAVILAADSTALPNRNRNHIERFIGLLDSAIDIPLVYPPNTFSSTASVVYNGNDSILLSESSNAIPADWVTSESFYVSRVTFKSTLTSIGDRAFATSTLDFPITLPTSLTTIGEDAFRDCTLLIGSLTIPDSVTTIGSGSFYYCQGLTGLTIGNSVTSIGAGAFQNDQGFRGSLTIPDSVTSIGDGAFDTCGFDGTLTIGNSVTTIPDNAFNTCSSLTGSLVIPNSVTSIGSYAFYNCYGFTELTIGSSVTSIGIGAFNFCSGFTGSLTIPNSVTTIGQSAFLSCSGLTGSLTIPNSVTTIGVNAFQGCSGLTGSLTIPNSVTSIGAGAFGSCSSLTGSLTISNSITSIGNNAFINCSGLTGSLTIPNSVTSIGDEAFSSCSGFTRIDINKSVAPTIGTSAFANMTGVSPAVIHVPVGATGYAASYDGLTVVKDL